jgi:hypothetical protein
VTILFLFLLFRTVRTSNRLAEHRARKDSPPPLLDSSCRFNSRRALNQFPCHGGGQVKKKKKKKKRKKKQKKKKKVCSVHISVFYYYYSFFYDSARPVICRHICTPAPLQPIRSPERNVGKVEDRRLPADRIDGDEAKVARVARARIHLAPRHRRHAHRMRHDLDLKPVAVSGRYL